MKVRILLFQLLNCDYFLFSSFFYGSKLSIFGLLTKKTFEELILGFGKH